jgi:hypothetical protein
MLMVAIFPVGVSRELSVSVLIARQHSKRAGSYARKTLLLPNSSSSNSLLRKNGRYWKSVRLLPFLYYIASVHI